MANPSSQTPTAHHGDIGSMISSHTLATSIISRHGTPDAVLDTEELSMLKEFCRDPSKRDVILADNDMKDEAGQRPGTKALQQRRSLVGLIIARYGTSEPALTKDEIQDLKDWFGQGGGV